MGTKVQLDNYYSMRDLNHDLNGTSWPSYCGENNLPNGQYYYGVLPRPNPDLFPGVDKDLLKQKMLEHEAVFKNQVFELHRLYRVQRDLMDEMRKKEDFKHRTVFEASSSSSPFADQTTPEDVRRRASSSFLFSNSIFVGPPALGPEFIGSSAGGGSHKGKNVQAGASPRNSEVSESRPTKVRRMIDLQLPADEYLDPDEVEQSENSKYQEIEEKPSACLRKPNALADLNEVPEIEETTAIASVDFLGFRNQDFVSKVRDPSVDVLWRPNHGNINGTQRSSCYSDRGNGENWFSSLLKAGVNNQANNFEKEPLHLKPVQAAAFENPHQPSRMLPRHHVQEDPWPAKENNSGFNVFDRSPHSSFNNSGGLIASQLGYGKPSCYQTQKPIPVQTTPFVGSPAQSNGFLGTWWHKNNYGSKNPVQDGFYYGSSSGERKELPCQVSKASLDHVNGSCNNKPRNSFDLNSTGDLNLNEAALPNGLSDGEAKLEDHVSVLPWLRATTSRNVLDHQDSVASTSCNVDATRGEKKILFDINLPCEDLEEFADVAAAAASECALVEDEKIESGCSNGVRNMIDLNSCLTEDEIPVSMTKMNSSKRSERCVIDLEAPINLEDDDDEEEEDEITDLVRVAAEAIVTISSSVPESRMDDEDALRWFVDIACSCSCPDEVNRARTSPDYFEEMTLKLTECTVDEYFPNPPKIDVPSTEESGPGPVTGRARRGPARRGRQKRDFQRDILPGLGSLARHEVTEDLQTFGGLMRATGHAWQCGTRRNGSSRRGRRKAVAAIPPPPIAIDATTTITTTTTTTATATAFGSCQKASEISAPVLEDGSLTSWGKTTRRPRRQRCPPGNPAPIALT